MWGRKTVSSRRLYCGVFSSGRFLKRASWFLARLPIWNMLSVLCPFLRFWSARSIVGALLGAQPASSARSRHTLTAQIQPPPLCRI
jgi:hypothetical protein